MKLSLTDAERLILSNQYEILSKLDKTNAEDHSQLAEQLRDGHSWLYREFPHMAPEMDPADATFVVDVLEMFGTLKASFEILSDKSGIDPNDVKFHGFDGNNESELLSFAGALHKAGRFVETLGPDVKNSHSTTRDLYLRLLTKFRELGLSYPLSKEAIEKIVAERVHPENRK